MKRAFDTTAFINSRKWFLLPFTLWIAAGAAILLCYTKADLHLLLTAHHGVVSDWFFKYYTEVGASIPYVVVAGLLFYRYRAAILVLAGQLLSGGLTQIGKHLWNEPRPLVYFSEHYPDIVLHQVEGVHLHHYHSFPSGHTTAAFALFATLCFLTKRKPLHLLYFILAALAGFSRIYLSQHFALDVWTGSFIGTTCAVLCAWLMEKHDFAWWNKSLLRR